MAVCGTRRDSEQCVYISTKCRMHVRFELARMRVRGPVLGDRAQHDDAVRDFVVLRHDGPVLTALIKDSFLARLQRRLREVFGTEGYHESDQGGNEDRADRHVNRCLICTTATVELR